MTRKKKCHSKSNSFAATAEQVCLQPVLEHRQRRGRRNIAWQSRTSTPCYGKGFSVGAGFRDRLRFEVRLRLSFAYLLTLSA